MTFRFAGHLALISFLSAPIVLNAQLREDALQSTPTAVSPSGFRTLQSTPLDERPATTLLVQAPDSQPQPPPAEAQAPAQTPPPGGPPSRGERGERSGPGGFGPRGGFGGFGSRNGGSTGATTDAETFRIEGDKVSLQFPNNNVSDILGIYEILTNKTLIKDTTIFEGQTISLVTPQPVEKTEAVKLIEAALLTNGYAIVAEPDGKSARILPTRTQGASTAQFSQGVRFYQSASDLPDNETIASYFMALSHLDPLEAADILGNHVGLSVYGRITPVLNPPGLLITENSNILRQLVNIKEVIDNPSTASSLITKFVPLKYADAATVAQIVQATIDAQITDSQEKGITTIRGGMPQSNQGDRNQQRPQQNQAGNQANSSKVTPEPRAKAQVIADARLNQVLIVAEPEDFTYITSLIMEFDKPVDVPEPYERKLKNIFSLDVIAVLADLLKENTATTQLPGGTTLSQQQQQQLITSSNQLITGRNAATTRGGTFSNTTATTDTDSVTSRADQLLEPEEDNAPISVLVNKTRIIADPLANSIIVIGPKEDQDKVDLLLDKLDRKSPQVYLATVIGQLTLGNGYEFGIDFLQKFTKTGSNSGMTSSLIATRGELLTNVSDMTTNLITAPIANAQGLNLYGQIGQHVDAFVNALESNTNFKVLSRPSVFALNNKKAVITSGQLIPVPSTSLTNASANNNNGNVTTTFDFRPVVLKLEVIPLINPDGQISLKIAQLNDTVIGTQVVQQNELPIIGTEELRTTVTVPNGHTIVLGGLITEQDNTTTEGIPVISRIPGLGRLFRNEVTNTQRKELIIFIQPIVVDDEGSIGAASIREDLRTNVGAHAAQAFPDQIDIPAPAPEPLAETKPAPASRPSTSVERQHPSATPEQPEEKNRRRFNINFHFGKGKN